MQVPLLCFSESFPWGVVAAPVEVVVKLIFTVCGWKGGEKKLLLFTFESLVQTVSHWLDVVMSRGQVEMVAL